MLGIGGQKGYSQIVLDVTCPLETLGMQWWKVFKQANVTTKLMLRKQSLRSKIHRDSLMLQCSGVRGSLGDGKDLNPEGMGRNRSERTKSSSFSQVDSKLYIVDEGNRRHQDDHIVCSPIGRWMVVTHREGDDRAKGRSGRDMRSVTMCWI